MDAEDIRKKATLRNLIAAAVAFGMRGERVRPVPPVRKCLRPTCEKTHQNRNAPFCSAECCELHRKESRS